MLQGIKRWQFWLGIVISVAFMWLALRGLRLEEVWRELQNARYQWLLPGIGVYLLGVLVRAWRWHYLLRPLKNIPTRTTFPIVAIGYMGNNIYPARAGELLRASILKRGEGVSMSASLATIVVERAFDGVVMLSFIFLNLPRLAHMTVDSGFLGNIKSLALLGTAAFLTAVLVFLLVASFPERTERIVEAVLNRLAPQRLRQRGIELVSRFLTGLASLRSPREVGMVLVTSAMIWLLETGKYWFVMQAFPFEVSFFALMLMNGIVNLATTIPSAPGYVGTFDAPGIAVLVAFGVRKSVATGYTLALHAALWLPITLLGAYFMLRQSLSWRVLPTEHNQEGHPDE